MLTAPEPCIPIVQDDLAMVGEQVKVNLVARRLSGAVFPFQRSSQPPHASQPAPRNPA
jgi:hypothetical protein